MLFGIALATHTLYSAFWLLTLFTQPRRGRVETWTSFSFHSGTRTAHNSSSCAASWEPFPHPLMNRVQGKAESAALTASLHLGEQDGQKAWCHGVREKCTKLLPILRDDAGRKVWGCLRHRLSSTPPGAVSTHHLLARTRRQMAQSTLPFIFRTLTALCKSQLCPWQPNPKAILYAFFFFFFVLVTDFIPK